MLSKKATSECGPHKRNVSKEPVSFLGVTIVLPAAWLGGSILLGIFLKDFFEHQQHHDKERRYEGLSFHASVCFISLCEIRV